MGEGRVEKRIYEISKRLVERGYEVHWFGMKWGDGVMICNVLIRDTGDCFVKLGDW